MKSCDEMLVDFPTIHVTRKKEYMALICILRGGKLWDKLCG